MTATYPAMMQKTHDRSAAIWSTSSCVDWLESPSAPRSIWNELVLSGSLAAIFVPETSNRSKALQSLTQYLSFPSSRSTATLVVDMRGLAKSDLTEGLLEESLPLIARASYKVKAVFKFRGPSANALLGGEQTLEE